MFIISTNMFLHEVGPLNLSELDSFMNAVWGPGSDSSSALPAVCHEVASGHSFFW